MHLFDQSKCFLPSLSVLFKSTLFEIDKFEKEKSEFQFPPFCIPSLPSSPPPPPPPPLIFLRQFPSRAVCTTPHPQPSPLHINHKFTQNKKREEKLEKTASDPRTSVTFLVWNQEGKKGQILRGWGRAEAQSPRVGASARVWGWGGHHGTAARTGRPACQPATLKKAGHSSPCPSLAEPVPSGSLSGKPPRPCLLPCLSTGRKTNIMWNRERKAMNMVFGSLDNQTLKNH